MRHAGLRDARSGKPRQYQDEHERCILAALDEPLLPSAASKFSAA